MSEMVMRVAKVMCDMQHGHGAFDVHSHLRDHFSFIARAGIEAMREPTDAMVDAANEVNAYWHHDTSELASEWREEMRQEYRAMIDGAIGPVGSSPERGNG